MTTSNLRIGFFISLAVVLLVFPLLSSAKFIETGPSCSISSLVDIEDMEDGTFSTCPWCPAQGSIKLKLEWELDKREFNDPLCMVTCSNSDGDTCSSAFNRDGDGVGVPNLDLDGNIRSKGSIYMPDVRSGNRYRVSCCETCTDEMRDQNQCDTSLFKLCKDNTGITSIPAKVVSDCKTPCEVPFRTILGKLSKGEKAVVTEVNFEGWSSINLKDNSHLNNNGSGDKADIVAIIDGYQSCQTLPRTADPEYYYSRKYDYDNIVNTIKESTDDSNPIMVGIINLGEETGHALLVLDLRHENGDDVMISVIDSSSEPGAVTYIDCTKVHRLDGNLGSQNFLECDGGFMVFLVHTLDSQRMDCSSGKRVRPDPANWLEDVGNHLDFGNLGTRDNSGGICFGYSEFIRNIACFGEFSGVDYHSDDGKYIGEACDENHMPLGGGVSMSTKPNEKHSRSTIWLASLHNAWSNFIKFWSRSN